MNNGKRKKWRKNNADRTREECLRAKGRVEIKPAEKAGSLFACARQYVMQAGNQILPHSN